jgi:magnesium transporter
MEDPKKQLPSQEMMNRLISHGDWNTLRSLLSEIHPADIAFLLDQLEPEDAVVVFRLLPLETASEVLDETGSRVRQELVEKVDEERLADLLDELPMDDAAEFLEDLPDLKAARLLDLMEPEEAEDVRELLRYEDETAGRLMTRDVVALRRHWTIAETLNFLRNLEDTDPLHYLYVVDRNNHLIGVVPLRELIKAKPEQTVESIMRGDVATVSVHADQEALAEMVARYDYYAMPVVDDANHLVGIVTVDDVLDVLAEEATEDIQRLGGSEPLDQPYFAVSVFHVVRKRIVWLLLLFVAATLTGTVIRQFEVELETVIALGIFIPLITGTGGNAGSQTVTTVIRALALGEVQRRDIFRVLWREIMVALLLGTLLGLIGFLRAITWDTGYRTVYDVSIVVMLTLPLVVLWANVVATVVPIVAEKLRIDPTVVSAPMITTVVDATGLGIYFLLAKWILGL